MLFYYSNFEFRNSYICTDYKLHQKMTKVLYSVVLLLAALCFTSCKEKTPEEVAETFANAFHNMDYKTAKSLATENSALQLDVLAQMASSLPEAEKENAKKVIITMGNGSITGDKASYFYTPSDNPTPQKVKLVKVKGKWLVEWNKNDDSKLTNPDNIQQAPSLQLETQPNEEIKIEVNGQEQ